jgi:hypothetical protein
MPSALAKLRSDEPGRDVDAIVGLIGALSKQSDSFHDAGFAEVLGRYLVLRAASRLGEVDAIDKAYAELDEEERAKLRRRHKEHRALACFLHELGHTLGALHERDPHSVMHEVYDGRMAGYGDEAIDLMRIALDHSTDRVAAARAQLEYLRASTSTAWSQGERETAMTMLARASGPPASGAASTPAMAPAPPDPLERLSPDDRQRYERALAMSRSAAVPAAYELAKPLFSTYADVLAVQDLRCQLAVLRHVEPKVLAGECDAFGHLSTARDAGAPR